MYIFQDNTYHSISTETRDSVSIVNVENKHCNAQLSLFGGHLLSFTPSSDGIERLWLSSCALFDKSRPIRGGVPICWPWFADLYPNMESSSALPAHGFVRTQDWRIVSIIENDELTKITLKPLHLGLHGFSADLSVQVEFTFAQKCTIKLITHNASPNDIKFTAALHTYFSVDDIRQTEIVGVEGLYADKTQKGHAAQQALPYLIESETDRIHHQDRHHQFASINLLSQPNTQSTLSGHDSVVIWNPWKDKSKSMHDMEDHGYLSMLCVEAAITKGVSIRPNEQHQLEQTIA